MDRLMSDENQNPSIRSVSILRSSGQTRDWLAVEEPLEMRVNGESLAVVLRTPGNDPYADIDLALRFLATEGVIDDMDDIDAIGHCTDPNVVNRKNVVVASLAAGTYRQFQRLRAARRSFFVGSSCGVCGKSSIENVFLKTATIEEPTGVSPKLLKELGDHLRAHQPHFSKTGGLHAAMAVRSDGAVLFTAEDIGRHNAVDKIVGRGLRSGTYPFDGHILFVSSRAGFEIVQKALMARFSAVVSVGAASSLAHDLARRSGLALYSFVRDGRYNHHNS